MKINISESENTNSLKQINKDLSREIIRLRKIIEVLERKVYPQENNLKQKCASCGTSEIISGDFCNICSSFDFCNICGSFQKSKYEKK